MRSVPSSGARSTTGGGASAGAAGVRRGVRGAVAAARQDDRVNPSKASSGSQFYIVENHDGTPMLDGVYTVFGQVVDGLDVIDKIAAQPADGRDRPLTDIKMKVTVENVSRKKIARKYDYDYSTQTLQK